MTTVNPRASLNCLLTRFSGLIALLRTFAWLMKFLQRIKWSSRKNKEETNTREITRCISHAEIEKSKREVVKLAQKSVFLREIKDLKAGRQVDTDFLHYQIHILLHPSRVSQRFDKKKYHQKIMQAFWKQWQREYLTGLREQHSSQANKNISGKLEVRLFRS